MIKPFGINNISIKVDNSPPQPKTATKTKLLIPPQEFNSYLSAHRYKEQTGCKRKIKKLGMNRFIV